jgi:hypothetical protein
VGLSEELAKRPDYIKRVNESLGHLQSNLNEVKTYLNKPLSDDNFNAAFQHLYNIVDVIPLLKVKLPSLQIVRGRPHYVGEQLCSETWQISFNWRFRDKIELGRFNQKAEPLFYGSLPVKSEDGGEPIDYVLSCALECCKELTIEYPSSNLQDITLGGWIVEKTFEVVILCFDEEHLKGNPDLRDGVNEYLNAIREHFLPDVADLIEQCLRFFSELSRTKTPDNASYKITCPLFVAIRHYFENVNKEPVYGLVYPSAMSMAKGLNIVITRPAVRDFLRLDKVIMYRYILLNHTQYVANRCSDMTKVYTRKFTIRNYIQPDASNPFSTPILV